MKKLVFLTQYFPPEMGAPQARIYELAMRLEKMGHTVSIITAMPNYPTGKIFPDYSVYKFIQEDMKGLNVLRCWIYPSKSTKFIKRLTNYFSFVFSSMYYGSKILDKQDFIIVESPPLFLGIAGIYLSWKLKAKMIFNVSDLWPDSAIELGILKNKIFIKLAKGLENLCYRKAIAITGQSHTIIEIIKKRTKKPTELISNGVDIEIFSPSKKNIQIKKAYGVDNKLVFVYAGLIGIAQGIGQILDAALQLKNYPDITFLIIGDGPEKENLQNRILSESLTNVIISDPIQKKEMPALLSSMDVAIIPLKMALTGAVPSKIYEAMASGLPIIFVGEGDGVRIIHEAQAGITIKPGDIDGLVHSIIELYENINLRQQLGQNGIKEARKFSRENIANRFNLFIENVLDINKTSTGILS